jgi:hypothetical protein
VAKAVVKHLDDVAAADVTNKLAAIEAARAKLKESWGANFDMNKVVATQGAKRLGVEPETVAALENVVGYDKIMEMFRQIGARTSEDTFVEGKGGGAAPVTRESARARLTELEGDKSWTKRLVEGDVATVNEWRSLTQQITGVAA